MKSILFILTLCIGIVSLAEAKTSIRGFVTDKTSGEPLPAANVVVTGKSMGASTNLDGFFQIPGVPSGKYTLTVSYLGYHGIEYDVEVKSGSMEPINIEMIPSSVKLKEVVYAVKSEDSQQIRKSTRVSSIPVDAKTIRMLPSLGAEMDVMRAMQSIPGVKSSSDVSSALYVRGGSADMTLIQMDQSTVYNPSHLFGLFSTFNGDAVKHLELMKGGFPAEYGGRAGSVLNVVTNDGNRKKTEGLLNVSIISARAAMEGPLPNNRGSYAISGRRTYFDPILNMMRSQEGMEDLPKYYFYDGNGKINWDLSPKTTLTVGGYLGLDELDAEMGPDDSRLVIGTYWGNQTFTSRLRHVMQSNSYLTMSAAFSRYRSGFDMENEETLLWEFKNRFRDVALRTDYEYYGLENHKIKTGIEARRYSVEVHSRTDDADFVNIDTSNWNYSHYIQDSWKLGAQLEIMPGVRYYYHEDSEDIKVDPRLAAVYRWNEKTRYKVAAGRYHQYLSVVSSGMDIASSMMIWMPNDGTMPPAYADQIVLGFEHDPRPDLEFTLEGYYTDFNDIMEINNSIDRGRDMEDAFLKGDGYAYGLEWMLRKKAGKVTGWIGYSLSWTKRQFEGSYINDGESYYPRWDRRHDFISVMTYKLSKNWDMSGSWRFNTGQGFTQTLGIYTYHDPVLDPDYSNQGNRITKRGSKNNYRFPEDHRLDLTFTYNHKCLGKWPAKLNFSIYNVYSRRSYWFRNEDKTKNPIEISDVKLLPVLPLIGYEVRF